MKQTSLPIDVICPACETAVTLAIKVEIHGGDGDFSISANVDVDAMWTHYEACHMTVKGDGK